MSIFRKLFGLGEKRKDVEKEREPTKRQGEATKLRESTFRGEAIPVTDSVDDFIRLALHKGKTCGLSVRMEEYVRVYGELLHSGGAPGSHNSLHVSASRGPCYVICEGCEMEMSEQLVAALGSNSLMAAFGLEPVVRCPECGHRNAVIVYAPGV